MRNYSWSEDGSHCETVAELAGWLRIGAKYWPIEQRDRRALVDDLQVMHRDGVVLVEFLNDGDEAVLGTDDPAVAAKYKFEGGGAYTEYEAYCPSYGETGDDLAAFIRNLREETDRRAGRVEDEVKMRLDAAEDLEALLADGYVLQEFIKGSPEVRLVAAEDPEDVETCHVPYLLG